MMSLIRLSSVSFSYRDPIDVLSECNLDIHRGWTGVVGPNGGGKSTLLGLLSSALVPTKGTVMREPGDAIVHLCPQRGDELSPAITAFGDSWTRADIRLKARLNLVSDHLTRWSSLSPGERKRWQIGAALAVRPDMLLLDEPSNHLDVEARTLLCEALARFRGIGVVVAHDRSLLDALTTHTVRVQDGSAVRYRGGYHEARERWQAEEDALRKRYATLRKRETHLRRRLADERRQRAGAERAISARSRMKGPKDHDSRSILAKNRAMNGEARHGRKVAILRDEVARVEADASQVTMTRSFGRSLFIDHQSAPRPYLMGLDGVDLIVGGDGDDSLDYGPRTLVQALRVAVERDSRIHIAGPNGAGKSTLLAALYRSAPHPERVLYLPQTITPAAGRALLSTLTKLDAHARGQVLQIAAALGVDPARVLATEAPSPGELRKLAIARGLGLGAWAVMLDEPTNHLDLPSIERLEAALVEYPGALVLASHDRDFARVLTNTMWHLDDGRLDIHYAAATSA